ncbi:Uu.00g047180.m01.CDS01 [Anthostomella pinea]|uniref:Uu.00g047180.m01.CDS01 n=1 Tax=Anthostomella pinea TaxID=933095 RepID=A0AAI8VCG1_9PEZI|nr:Uu.00g047180.m01.CDS01 [Anthostomella pinea]
MPSDLSSYLATHYLTADPKPTKKRKRKQGDVSTGLIIADDDDAGWTRASGRDDDEEGGPAMVTGTSAEFRKAKKSSWKVLGGGSIKPGDIRSQNATNPEQDQSAKDANAILASAAAETKAADDADDAAAAVMMSDGTFAGLQTGATVNAQLEARRRRERAEFETETGGKGHKEAETIYRDATGRRVDVSMKRAELRREAEEAAKKERDAQEALKGEVQIEASRRRREDLLDAKTMAVARGADDEEMNAEMKGKVRWGDTMVAFVGQNDGRTVGAAGGGGGGKGSGGKKIKGRPIYQGAWAPNRYQIRPGYRWDGVDRSNGFEAERFKAINRRERNKGLEYSWQIDE